MKEQKAPRQGWRWFVCPECSHEWKEETRDSYSPSGVDCPKCQEWCFPVKGEVDTSVLVDNLGNLVKERR
jgi:Zn finger protein HypA/HybF involved in hydrogenase expression